MYDGTYARVGHTGDGVEDCSTIHQWYQWPGDATCHVTQQAGPLYLDILYYQGGGLSGLQHARTAGLVGCHPGERDACS
jgi:hypothetical protein